MMDKVAVYGTLKRGESRGNVLNGGESTTVQFFLAESTTATCGVLHPPTIANMARNSIAMPFPQ